MEKGGANPPNSADSTIPKAFTLSLKCAAKWNKIVSKALHKHQKWTCGCQCCTVQNTTIRISWGHDKTFTERDYREKCHANVAGLCLCPSLSLLCCLLPLLPAQWLHRHFNMTGHPHCITLFPHFATFHMGDANSLSLISAVISPLNICHELHSVRLGVCSQATTL